MTTYYVSKGGNDATAVGDDMTKPYLTIAGAIGGASTNGDTIEIIDEGAYNEGNIDIFENNLTITHTASALGRPKMHGTGLSGLNDNRAFYVYGEFITYNGIEFSDYTDHILKKGDTSYNNFHMSGCFVHNVPKLGSHAFAGDATTKSTINDCIIFLENGSSDGIGVTSNLIFNNCLITSSNNAVSNDAWIAAGALTVTASFCTIIDRGPGSNGPVIEIGKAINCIVSGGASVDGIASDDHTYNLVYVGGNSWRTMADDGNGVGGTGDLSGSDPIFTNPYALGSGSWVAGFYQLQAASPCVDAGTSYNATGTIGDHDISGTARPAGIAADMGCFERPPPTWISYGAEPKTRFGADLVINSIVNLSDQYRRNYAENVEQVPFGLATPGPASLRNRSVPYFASRSNPNNVVSGGLSGSS